MCRLWLGLVVEDVGLKPFCTVPRIKFRSIQKVETVILPKSKNRVPADYVTVLSWCKAVLEKVSKKTILEQIDQCYINPDPEEIELSDVEEEVKTPTKPKKEKKARRKIVALKSKTTEALEKLNLKKERKRKWRKQRRNLGRRGKLQTSEGSRVCLYSKRRHQTGVCQHHQHS